MKDSRQQLLTIRDVADLLKISQASVRNLTIRGKLPAPVRLGRLIRWRPGDLTAFLERRDEDELSPISLEDLD